jgi:NAD+ synthase
MISGRGKKWGPETRRIVRFVVDMVDRAGAKGVVVGLSGGIDSSAVGALCVRALGKDRVVGLVMPSATTPAEDVTDAKGLASSWGIELVEVDISGMVDAVVSGVAVGGTRISRANVQARMRMVILYYAANSRGMLVAGTGDRSEEELGFFTKFGDGGSDFLPIAHLYKTQVRSLGRYLGLPQKIVEKQASPQLWPGHTAEEELPTGYEKLDLFLSAVDVGKSVELAAERAGVSLKAAKDIMAMRERSEHKRMQPPSLA